MKFSMISKILGILLMFFSVSMLTPILIGFYYHHSDLLPFGSAFLITFMTGLVLWGFNYKAQQTLKVRDGFMIVFLMWCVLSAFGALPLMLDTHPHIPWSDALFESVSGLTTTGATALFNIDHLPKALLFYRDQLQFLGGMGIIVLAVAVFPLMGVGGMQLFKAEATGPMKDSKLTPKIMETAKMLWLIYIILNILCAVFYWWAGMSKFDAICYAFGTLSTGGFAPHGLSIAYYASHWIKIISIIFMFLGGVNFSLHFLTIKHKAIKRYFMDAEFRVYLGLFLIIGLLVSFILYFTKTYLSIDNCLLQGFYQVVSFGTTTGFTTGTAYSAWPFFLPILLLLMGMLGACSGSTTGGIKIIRLILMRKHIRKELDKLIHPNGTFPIKLNGKLIPDRVMSSVWAFLGLYILLFILLLLILMGTGLDFKTAFSALATCISNTGPGLGQVTNSFGGISATARWILAFAMLVGRLELFTVLVLISPAFWRR